MPFQRQTSDAAAATPQARPPLSAEGSAQVRSLQTVRCSLEDEAKGWALQLTELAALSWRAEKAGAQERRELPMELAGAWRIGQLTAERWLAEADRFSDALPLALSMLGEGRLLKHQALAVLHELAPCTAEVARAVEAEVLPAGAALCPTDLRRTLKRVRLRIEDELLTAEQAEQQEAEKVGRRRTWTRPTEDGMALAGAVTTPEQNVAWARGMDALERRERLADRAAGIDRTAEQRRADLFASLPAIVLAGLAADDRWRKQEGVSGGRAPLSGDGALPGLDGPVPPPWALTTEQIAAQITLNVHVPVATILDLSQEPGSLDGFGPISAQHVRLVRPKSFRRVMVEAVSGRPIAVDEQPTSAADTEDGRRAQVRAMLRPDVITDADEPQHDPSARLARLIDLRDVHCCGPGCSTRRTDRDHLVPYRTGGSTSARNLGLVSPRCHSAKHHGWVLARHPDGSATWHSRYHQTYTRPGPWAPPPRVDLHADPPPRPRRTAPKAEPDPAPDVPLTERARRNEPHAPAPERRPGWDDEPPF